MTRKRSIKVYGQSGYKYRETPTIMLKGMWLKEAGFDIGDYSKGEVPQYFVENHHPSIVSPDIFDQVQAEFERRKKSGKRAYKQKSQGFSGYGGTPGDRRSGYRV